MNTSTVPETSFKEAVPDSRFLVQAPLNNRFLSSSAIAVTRSKDGLEVEVELQPYKQVGADDVLEGIIARTKRDVDRHPRSARARVNLGLALLNRGDAQGAMRELELALEHEPGDYVAAASLARVKLDTGDIDGAETLYRDMLKRIPDDISSLMNMAFICMRRSDFEGAARLLRVVVAQNEKAPLPRYHLAMVLLKLGRTSDAIAQLRIAARADVRSPELHHALGVAYTASGQLKRAANAFRIAITLAPKMIEAIHGLALVWLQGGEAEAATALLQQQVEKVPEDWTAREMLARLYFLSRQYERARVQLNYVFQGTGAESPEDRQERARIANNMAACYASEGNSSEARKWLKEAIDQRPEVALPYGNFARLLLSERSVSEAVALLEDCKKRFPDDEPTRVLLSISYDRLGDYDKAIAEITPLVESPEAPPWVFAYQGALLAEQSNDFAAGLKVFEAGLRKHPFAAVIINNFAYAHLRKGHVEEARTLLNSLPKGEELYPELLATFGLLRLWEGDLRRGRDLYHQAADLASSTGNSALARMVRQKMHLELARAYLRQRDVRLAIQQIKGGLSIKEGRDDCRQDLQALLAELSGEQRLLFPPVENSN